MKLIPKVTSIHELGRLARTDSRYAQLLTISAANLGGGSLATDDALAYLLMNAAESGDEAGGGGEAGVVGEINFCRDLVQPTIFYAYNSTAKLAWEIKVGCWEQLQGMFRCGLMPEQGSTTRANAIGHCQDRALWRKEFSTAGYTFV